MKLINLSHSLSGWPGDPNDLLHIFVLTRYILTEQGWKCFAFGQIQIDRYHRRLTYGPFLASVD